MRSGRSQGLKRDSAVEPDRGRRREGACLQAKPMNMANLGLKGAYSYSKLSRMSTANSRKALGQGHTHAGERRCTFTRSLVRFNLNSVATRSIVSEDIFQTNSKGSCYKTYNKYDKVTFNVSFSLLR